MIPIRARLEQMRQRKIDRAIESIRHAGTVCGATIGEIEYHVRVVRYAADKSNRKFWRDLAKPRTGPTTLSPLRSRL